MKLKKVIIAFGALVTLGAASGVASNTTSPVQAKNNTPVYPKKMRGTWYAYHNNGHDSYFQKMTFTKNNHIYYDYNGHTSAVMKLKKYVPHDKPDFEGSHQEHIKGYRKFKKLNWINIQLWNDPPEINTGQRAGVFYNVSKINGHQVLSVAKTVDGKKICVTYQNYHSRKVAKKMAQHHYKGFLYW